jgi:hypothetical protein
VLEKRWELSHGTRSRRNVGCNCLFACWLWPWFDQRKLREGSCLPHLGRLCRVQLVLLAVLLLPTNHVSEISHGHSIRFNIRHSLNRLINRSPRPHCQFLFLQNNYIYLFFMRHPVVYYSMINPKPLMWKIWWAPNNASRWQMGFNSACKGLIQV